LANFFAATIDGNFSSATTWAKSSNAIATQGNIHATTNITPTTGGVNAVAFTAPNITGNKSVGAMVYCTTKAGTGDWTATLQEDSGAGFANVAGATSTITNSNMIAAAWTYFKWTTPYAYTVATASKYRIQVKVSSSSSGTAAADAAGTAIYCIELNDIGGPPALGDRGFITTANNSGTRTVTVTGTSGNNIGDNAVAAASLQVVRDAANALHIQGLTSSGAESILKWDTAASSTLTIRGMLVRAIGSETQRGTVASPLPLSVIATLIFDSNGVEGQAGGMNFSGARVIEQGSPVPNTTDWKRSYVSGSGTTIDPLIISGGAAFSVNDHIMITSAVSGQSEWKFIKTVNSATSYTLSSTAGGVEAGLSFTHLTTDYVTTLNRNIVTLSNSTTQGWHEYNRSTIAGDVALKWARYESCGNSISGKEGWRVQGTTATQGTCDYCVGWQPRYDVFSWVSSKVATTSTGLIATSGGSTNAASTVGAFLLSSAGAKTFVDCFAVGLRRMGVQGTSSSNCTLTRFIINGNNLVGTTSSSGLQLANCASMHYNNCDIQGNTIQGIIFSGATDNTFTNCTIGNVSTNTVDILSTTDFYNTVTFTNSIFGSATLVSNYVNAVPGTLIKFHRYQNTDNNHRWYTVFGSAQSTGATLTDTNVRTPSSLALRLTPEDGTDGFSWQFYIPAKALSIINFYGWFQLNAAFTGDAAASARVELWLPNSTVADATATLSKSTNAWQAISLSASNAANTVDGLAQVFIYGVTATPGAYVYVDDLYNAGDTMTSTDKVTGLDTWLNGQPAPIITPQSTSAADIWTFNTSNLTTPNTTGAAIKQIIQGTAVAGGANSITLDSNASATSNLYNYNMVHLIAGTGAGQARFISSYNGTTKVATMASAWAVNPDSTSIYVIRPFFGVQNVIWDELTSNHTTIGTTGAALTSGGGGGGSTDALTLSEFMGLKKG
jgi:hypothetical protein